MDEVGMVCVDLAKQVFQVHGAASDGRVLFRKRLSRPQFVRFMGTLPRCIWRWRPAGRRITGVESWPSSAMTSS